MLSPGCYGLPASNAAHARSRTVLTVPRVPPLSAAAKQVKKMGVNARRELNLAPWIMAPMPGYPAVWDVPNRVEQAWAFTRFENRNFSLPSSRSFKGR
jgi:hypothetical protein